MKALLSIDFDGVLHTLETAYSVDDLGLPASELLAAGLFAYRQTLEDLLVRFEHVGLVVHSSWRLTCSEARIRELLGPLSHRMDGVTPTQFQERELSILEVLRRQNVPRNRVVVLDDQAYLFRKLRGNLVECPPDLGVTGVLDKLNDALKGASR
jgi:hypothetical protein